MVVSALTCADNTARATYCDVELGSQALRMMRKRESPIHSTPQYQKFHMNSFHRRLIAARANQTQNKV
jgi:hypothetical protein